MSSSLHDEYADPEEVERALTNVQARTGGAVPGDQHEVEADLERPRGGGPNPPGLHPTQVIARRYGDGRDWFKTTSEVAEIVGYPAETVRKWARQRKAGVPSHRAPYGERTIALYSKEDVEALQVWISLKYRIIFMPDGARRTEV